MKQWIQSSHIPPCHRHIVIAATLSVHCFVTHKKYGPLSSPLHTPPQWGRGTFTCPKSPWCQRHRRKFFLSWFGLLCGRYWPTQWWGQNSVRGTKYVTFFMTPELADVVVLCALHFGRIILLISSGNAI